MYCDTCKNEYQEQGLDAGKLRYWCAECIMFCTIEPSEQINNLDSYLRKLICK